MSNKEILAIYKTAEKHWSRPIWLCKWFGWKNTEGGFCNYFASEHKHYWYSTYFKNLWIPYRTTNWFNEYHFYSRKERLDAIRKVIKDLEVER